MPAFMERLVAAVRRTETPVLVGLDPRWTSLPASLRAGRDGHDRKSCAAAYREFCMGLIDVVSDLVPAVKPQAAFFEQLGVAGCQALSETVAYARQRNVLVILDGKRNDIGSTATAYADAYLGEESAWQADALTVSPYLGSDSLLPFVETAQERDAGIFVLVKTSNPGGGQFQDLISLEQPIYEHVAQHIESLAQQSSNGSAYGVVGAVVGATYPEQLGALRQKMTHTWFLVPGFGAQGGTAKDVSLAFDQQGLGAIVNSSRGIIFAQSRPEYCDRYSENQWQQAVEAATHDMIAQLRSETPASRLHEAGG